MASIYRKGSRVTVQHYGAKAHAEGTVQGTIEDSSFTGDGKDDVLIRVFWAQVVWGSLCGTLEGLLEAIEFGDSC